MSGSVRCSSDVRSRPTARRSRPSRGPAPIQRPRSRRKRRSGQVVLRPRVRGTAGPGSRCGSARGSRRACGRGSRDRRADLGGQLGRDPLVGVDRQDPVARGQRQRRVALGGEVVEGADDDDVGIAPGDRLESASRLARIDHDDALVGQARPRPGSRGRFALLVAGQDQDARSAAQAWATAFRTAAAERPEPGSRPRRRPAPGRAGRGAARTIQRCQRTSAWPASRTSRDGAASTRRRGAVAGREAVGPPVRVSAPQLAID